jgi:hypothetical protein
MVSCSEWVRHQPHGRVQMEHYDQLHFRFCPVVDHGSGRNAKAKCDLSVEHVVFPSLILDSCSDDDRAARGGMSYSRMLRDVSPGDSRDIFS